LIPEPEQYAMYASLLIGLAVVVGAPKGKDLPKKEATIVGEWIGEKAHAGGKELPVPEGGITFTFAADGGLTVKEGNRQKPDAGSYKLDPKKDPPEIDLIPPTDKKEPLLPGIYKLDGDTLTLCFSRGGPGGERPKNFESPEGSQVIVMTLKRAKKD
jgi:uncharacterized protein (TIGR03067 family)